MSTPATKATTQRPVVSPTPPGATDVPSSNPSVVASPTARRLTGPLNLFKSRKEQGRTGRNATFGTKGRNSGADGSAPAIAAAPALPTGYASPPGVGGLSRPSQPQMPQRTMRQQPMPMPPNRQMRPPMPPNGQSPLHHLWESLTKIGENMANLVQAIARAMGSLHH
jgi:hypothetical protein